MGVEVRDCTRERGAWGQAAVGVTRRTTWQVLQEGHLGGPGEVSLEGGAAGAVWVGPAQD